LASINVGCILTPYPLATVPAVAVKVIRPGQSIHRHPGAFDATVAAHWAAGRI